LSSIIVRPIRNFKTPKDFLKQGDSYTIIFEKLRDYAEIKVIDYTSTLVTSMPDDGTNTDHEALAYRALTNVERLREDVLRLIHSRASNKFWVPEAPTLDSSPNRSAKAVLLWSLAD
jgi:hypothetical protein